MKIAGVGAYIYAFSGVIECINRKNTYVSALTLSMHTCRKILSMLRIFLHNFLVVSAIISLIFLFHNINQRTDGRKNAYKRR